MVSIHLRGHLRSAGHRQRAQVGGSPHMMQAALLALFLWWCLTGIVRAAHKNVLVLIAEGCGGVLGLHTGHE